jgi:mannitol-1-/sugar-/sorbitol-6-/2-deoxyglucose-6-phosphatase
MIEAVIFDLDGTIIDSEPFWLEAGFEVLQEEGLPLLQEDLDPTEGLNTKDTVAIFYPRLKHTAKTMDEITKVIDDRAMEKILSRGELRPGINEMICFLKESDLPLAIASSTVVRLIKVILDHFKLKDYFDIVCSAESEIYGKPHPGIYITTANKLKVKPEKCVAIEDSLNGMIAAKAARMKLIAYLHDDKIGDTKYDFADLKLESFHNFGPSDLEYLHTIV